MKVKRIDLDDEEMPERVLVELSHDEATYLATLLGKQNHNDGEAVLRGGAALGGAVYDGLTGGIFNRFYEDGVAGAVAAMRGARVTNLVPLQPSAAPAAYDPATLAVLAAMEQAAEEHLDAIRPHNTKRGYENDWNLWEEFQDWLGERTGHRVASTHVTKGMLVGFVVWLDTIKLAAPASIDRRITGVTVTARGLGVEVPKEATVAARKALKPLKLDPDRIARGRGKAPAATPEQLRQMYAAAPAGLAGLRDRALWLMAFGIAGRSAEVSALRADGIQLVSEGLDVHVPSVKQRPPRDVVVAYGKNPDTCPVRAWLTWKAAAGLTSGPAFRPVSVHGHLGTDGLTASGCQEIISRSAERAGVAVRLTGHSMRAGFITTSRKAGKREEKIRAQSGHAANSPVFWGYIQEADRWVDAASDDIGL